MAGFERCKVDGCRGHGTGRHRPLCKRHWLMLADVDRVAIYNAASGTSQARYDRALDEALLYLGHRLDAELVSGRRTD